MPRTKLRHLSCGAAVVALATACASGDPADADPTQTASNSSGRSGSSGDAPTTTAGTTDGEATGDPSTGEPAALELAGLHPTIVDPIGGSHLTLTGSGFTGATAVTIGGAPVSQLDVRSDTELRVVSGAVASASGLDVIVRRGADEAVLAAAVDAWSPAEIAGARVFDAALGVTGDEPTRTYEWARVSESIAPDWRIRDGNTTTWLPATGKFWMVGGWNGNPVPDGFDDAPMDTYPPHNTTNEVWSSPDGATWTQELPHDHPQWERRHAHSTVLWRDRLWMIGGDHHQGKYNHDVVSSGDGVTWQIENPDPPWQPRALAISGAYADQLWMVGGQDLAGAEEDYVYHNDVWRSDDGITWQNVVPDAPASATRWGARSMVSQLLEFKGRMWLLGGATYTEGLPRTYYQDVWSTTDGVTWTEHAAPPWQAVTWHSTAVFDDRMWTMFGANDMGNHNQVWYSDDGESWTEIPLDRNPTPTSHAQGIAVGPDFLLYAGGNYTLEYTTKSTWRLKAWRGVAVESWTDRGTDALTVAALAPERRPVLDPNALGVGIPGVQFDGGLHQLELPASEPQPDGRSVFWVGRAPWTPAPPDWDAPPTINPLATIVGDDDEHQACAVGLGDGMLYYTSAGMQGWQSFRHDADLAQDVGHVRFAGITHAADGTARGFVDGAPVGDPQDLGYSASHGWRRISGGLGAPENTGFTGSLGAVIIVPAVLDDSAVARVHAWAQGRFLAP